MRALSIGLIAVALSGCSTMSNGTSQTISAPIACTVYQNGQEVGKGTTSVKRGAGTLEVSCPDKLTTYTAKPTEEALFGMMFDLGIVDMITGAYWEYVPDGEGSDNE